MAASLLAWAEASCSGDPAAAGSEREIAALADSVLEGARARDADRFVSHFTSGDLIYVINTRRLSSREELREAFRVMLARQREFDPRWTDRHAEVIAPGVAVFTGEFRTAARDTSGERWQAEGIVTFTARLEPNGWRVVRWHTTERVAAP